MTWYQSGSVTVTQGSATVTGAGTDFMAPNVFPGDGFVDEAGYTYEVVGAQSSTQLTISPAYRGASGGAAVIRSCRFKITSDCSPSARPI